MIDAELAILSIVAEGPIHGYAIESVITERGLRGWTNIGTSSLFYVLQKLERQGLLTSTLPPQPEADQAGRQYRITPAGYGVLQTAIADLLSTPRDYSNGFELGLANLHVLPPEQIRTAFTAYTQELETRLHQMRVRRDRVQNSPVPLNITAIFDRHIALLGTELTWLTQFIAAWEAQAPPDDSPSPPEPADIPRMKQVILPHDSDSPHRVPTRRRHPGSGHPPSLSEAETDRSLSTPDAATTSHHTDDHALDRAEDPTPSDHRLDGTGDDTTDQPPD